MLNSGGGTIISVTMTGGNVGNGGRIGNLTYFAGMYVGETRYREGDGEWETFIGTIDTLTVNGSSTGADNFGTGFINSGTIDNATLNSGRLDSYGTITNATVNGGTLMNFNISGSSGSATIDNTAINDGTLFNHSTIGNATVNGGSLNSDGTIIEATLKGGILRNMGTVTEATASAGWLINYDVGAINHLKMYGGDVSSAGRIDRLEYVSGSYEGSYGGTIGTLTVAGDLYASNDWGIVENLKFAEDGSGTLIFTGYISTPITPAFAPMNFMATNAALIPEILFNSFQVGSVDLTYGNILFDLSGIMGFSGEDLLASLFADGFSLASLFGTDDIQGMEALTSFGVNWGEGNLWILEEGKFTDGWSFSGDRLVYSSDNGGGDPSNTPEPATLLMLGLGAIGAGLAARRKMRNVK